MEFKAGELYKARIIKTENDCGIDKIDLYIGKVFTFRCGLGFKIANDPYNIDDELKYFWNWDVEQLDFDDVDDENATYFKEVKKEFKKNSEDIEIKLPQRATQGSAGYDFYLPYDVIIEPKQEVMLWTDIKVKMPMDLVFEIVMRSSYGIKKSLMLKNIIGKIDSDYYGNETTDGNIGLCLYNYGTETQSLKKGDAFCQGTFFNYYITDNDCPVSETRSGGIGSTGV